jgi:glycosyltransferase involved in cell wall biosynthesis
MNLVWILHPPPDMSLEHGGTLRFVNFARELSALGHAVHFVMPMDPIRPEAIAVLDGLVGSGAISGYSGIQEYKPPRSRSWAATLCLHPRAQYHMFRRGYDALTARILRVVSGAQADCLIVTRRDWLLVLPELARRIPTVVDWCDSLGLQNLRGLRVSHSGLADKIRLAKHAWDNASMEFAMAGVAAADLFVAGRDCEFVAGRQKTSRQFRVIPNGVSIASRNLTSQRNRDRLIFSGVMSFEPNLDAALWFIKKVFPRVKLKRPDVTLTIAGKDPPPELRRLASDSIMVAGFVPDLDAEISSSGLYVAPLISGSGFKNKVAQALACGTFVAATELAAECLPSDIRAKLLVSRGASEMASQILDFLANREAYDQRRREAQELVRTRMTWRQSALALEGLMRQVVGDKSWGPALREVEAH